MDGTAYNPFKADVFALATSILHMTTLTSPVGLITSEPLDGAVEMQVAELEVSGKLQELLKRMLKYEESLRPTMLEVCCEVIKENPAIKYFAAVWGNEVIRYHLKSQQTINFRLPFDFGKGGSYVALNRTALLCVGAEPASTDVFELDLSSFQLTALPRLNIPRNGAGIAKVADCIYVFGSWVDLKEPALKSCEKYDLRVEQWQTMGDMKYGKCCFTPCIFRSLIYLPCPLTTTRIIETFDPETEIFADLPVHLPLSLKYLSVAFVANQELCILTSGKQDKKQLLGRWKIDTESEFRLSDSGEGCWSSQSPLIMGSFVLIANTWERKVQKFSLESFSFI